MNFQCKCFKLIVGVYLVDLDPIPFNHAEFLVRIVFFRFKQIEILFSHFYQWIMVGESYVYQVSIVCFCLPYIRFNKI